MKPETGELHNLYFLRIRRIIKLIRSIRITSVGHEARITEMRMHIEFCSQNLK